MRHPRVPWEFQIFTWILLATLSPRLGLAASCDDICKNPSSSPIGAGQLKQHCDAYKLSDDGKGAEKNAGIAYTVAAASCTEACVIELKRDAALAALRSAAMDLATSLPPAATTCSALTPVSPSCSSLPPLVPPSDASYANLDLTISQLIASKSLNEVAKKKAVLEFNAANGAHQAVINPQYGQISTCVLTSQSITAASCAAGGLPGSPSAVTCAMGMGMLPLCQSSTVKYTQALGAYQAAAPAAVSSVETSELATTACTAVGGAAALTDVIQSAMIKKYGEAMMAGAGVGAAGASLYGNETAKKYMGPCVLAPALAAAAALRFYNMRGSASTSDQACKSIQALVSGSSTYANTTTPGVTTPPSGGTSGSVNPSGGSSSNGAASNYQINVDKPQKVSEQQIWEQAKASAAPDPVFSSLQNKDAMPQFLAAKGLSVSEIGRRFGAESPASIISSMNGIPSGVSAVLKELEESTKSGKMDLKLPTFAMPKGGSGGGSKFSQQIQDSLFKKSGGMEAPQQAEVSFGKRGLASADTGEDIWHEQWHGSIFDIVTVKMNKTRDRIDQLEWVLPINRAMNGQSLYPKSKSK